MTTETIITTTIRFDEGTDDDTWALALAGLEGFTVEVVTVDEEHWDVIVTGLRDPEDGEAGILGSEVFIPATDITLIWIH